MKHRLKVLGEGQSTSYGKHYIGSKLKVGNERKKVAPIETVLDMEREGGRGRERERLTSEEY